MALSYNKNEQNNSVSIKDPKASGALADLYSSDYNIKNLFYPRNLASQSRGHWIVFYINVAQNSKFLQPNGIDFVGNSNNLNGQVVSSVNQETLELTSLGGRTEVNQRDVLTISRRTKRINTAIALYMPDTVNVRYDANWQDLSLTSAGGLAGVLAQGSTDLYKNLMGEDKKIWDAAKNILTEAGAGLADSAAGKVIGLGQGAGDFVYYAAGKALNPQLEVLFKGVQLRQHQFDFMFAPHTREEAVAVREIIEAFKFHAAPEIDSNSSSGRYMVPPSEFDIDFMYKNSKNPNLHQIGTCVLTNIAVDYAPNGWATFGGEDTGPGMDSGAGSPVQTKLTLTFQETEIVTKDRVLEGY